MMSHLHSRFLSVCKAAAMCMRNIHLTASSSPHGLLQVVYLLDKPPTDNWQGELGYLTVDMAKKYFPPPSNDNLILVCGPPPMMKAISGDKVSPKDQGELAGVLKEAGYTKDQVYKF